MEVILRKDIEHLGKVGDRVAVKDGYARNYLIPKDLAWIATEANLKKLEQEKRQKIAQEEKYRRQANELAQKLSGISCTIAVEANRQDKLYGKISQQDISQALEQEGIILDKKKIVLENPIEELGIYDATVNLGFDIKTTIKVWVVRK